MAAKWFVHNRWEVAGPRRQRARAQRKRSDGAVSFAVNRGREGRALLPIQSSAPWQFAFAPFLRVVCGSSLRPLGQTDIRQPSRRATNRSNCESRSWLWICLRKTSMQLEASWGLCRRKHIAVGKLTNLIIDVKDVLRTRQLYFRWRNGLRLQGTHVGA